MKKIRFILFLLVACTAASGQSTSRSACITTVTPQYKKLRGNSNYTQNMVTSLMHDTCVGKQFSLMFYIMDDEQGTGGGITQTHLDDAVSLLNDHFRRICIRFVTCTLKVIPNHTFNYWRVVTTESMVINNFYTPNTINVYLADAIVYDPPSSPLPAYTYLPGNNPKNIIVLSKSVLTSGSLSERTNLLHEMGHFFGLPNTNDEIGNPVVPGPTPPIKTYEYVDRSNCYNNGDGFCDTEADNDVPAPQSPSPKDGKGEFYVIPSDNFMSSYGNRCRYSQEQYNFMARMIVNQMLYLN